VTGRRKDTASGELFAEPLPDHCRPGALDRLRQEARSEQVQIDGPGIEAQDRRRLGNLLDRVARLMADGRWRTLREIQRETGGSETSVSARLRDLRKPRNGARIVNRRRVQGGTWQYRLVPKQGGPHGRA